MKNYLLSFVLFLSVMLNLFQHVDGQNLVPNGSFEELIGCPAGFNAIDSCAGWFTEIFSPDCIATCAPYPVSVPNNVFGFQYPFEGNNYTGIITFLSYFGSFAVRETFGAKLIDSLIIGNTYHFSMRVSHAYNDTVGVVVSTNHLSVKFSKEHHTDYEFATDNLPQLYEDSIITDSVNWILLQWDYTADSSYKYIYIGAFFENSHIDTLNAGQPLLEAYYYVDSVNLFCVSANCATGITDLPKDFIQLSPNPLTTQLHIQYAINQPGELMVYDALGRKVKSCSLPSNQKTVQLSLGELPAGVYLVAINSGGQSFTEKVVKQ